MRHVLRFVLAPLALLAGCAPPRHAPPPSIASTAPPPPAAEAEEPVEHTLSMQCASEAAPCVPDPAFVKRLCTRAFPDVALLLMSKESPFARMYLRGETDGWNADGGASTRARLLFDEEMLVLKRRAPATSGIVVGSAGASYLVLRWDGNCFTLDENELTSKRPPSPKHGPLPFRFYSDATKHALLERPRILAAFQARGKECKGATSGDVSKACERADTALSSVIVSEVRAGLTIPVPELLP